MSTKLLYRPKNFRGETNEAPWQEATGLLIRACKGNASELEKVKRVLEDSHSATHEYKLENEALT